MKGRKEIQSSLRPFFTQKGLPIQIISLDLL